MREAISEKRRAKPATTRICERCDRRGADSGARQMRLITSLNRRPTASAIAGLALAE